MSYLRETVADQYEAESYVRGRCRDCGRSSADLEDARCPRCLGEDVDAEQLPAVRKAIAELHRKVMNRYPWDSAWFAAQIERLEGKR